MYMSRRSGIYEVRVYELVGMCVECGGLSMQSRYVECMVYIYICGV